MQLKSALLVTSTLAILAAATPAPLEARTGGGGTNQCNTGTAHCCNNLGVASSFSGNALWGLIQAVVSDLNTVIGVQCSPIAGGGSCSQTPVCCDGNNYEGLIVIGCSPIIIG